jgi:hypothetical protein
MKRISGALTTKALANEFARQTLTVALEKRGIKGARQIVDLIEHFMETKFEAVRELNGMPPLKYERDTTPSANEAKMRQPLGTLRSS